MTKDRSVQVQSCERRGGGGLLKADLVLLVMAGGCSGDGSRQDHVTVPIRAKS